MTAATLDLARTDLAPLVAPAADDPAVLDGYPDTGALADALAARWQVASDRILVTAGADDALARVFRATLAPGRSVAMTTPTFDMLGRFARQAGATLRGVPWRRGAFPLERMLAATDETTALLVVVSPNNPTGGSVSAATLRALATARPGVTLLVDLAYTDFADDDPTGALLDLPNVIVVRTFSKVWGLAAWRVGYAIAAPGTIGMLAWHGLPYPVASASVRMARRALSLPAAAVPLRRATVVRQRQRLTGILAGLDLDPLPSEANFVAIDGARATWIGDALASQRIATRHLPADDPAVLRITVPLDDADMLHLERSLALAASPDAILFDLDGVLADVSRSYREAIRDTAAAWGVALRPGEVADRKARGDANDDWQVTWELIRARGVAASLAEVTAEFERRYQGTPTMPGLRAAESLLPPADWLAALARRLPLAIVTGRPRRDAERFLAEQGVGACFRTIVAREDAPLKPDPAPVREALRRLGVVRAWMLGDTLDDLRAAAAAGALPIGVIAPGDDPASARAILAGAGAARVFTSLQELDACLP